METGAVATRLVVNDKARRIWPMMLVLFAVLLAADVIDNVFPPIRWVLLMVGAVVYVIGTVIEKVQKSAAQESPPPS